MKKQIIGGLFALFALFFTVVSCRKDIQTVTTETTQVTNQTTGKADAVKGDFRVENGTLHFDNQQTCYSVLEQLNKLDMSERRHFGGKMGFKSLLKAYNDVQLQSAVVDNEQDHKSILRDNSDIIDASANDGSFNMRIFNKNLASILNRDGIVFIGKTAYKFTDFGEVVNLDGDISSFNGITSTTKSSGNTRVFNFIDIPVPEAPCGVGMSLSNVMNSSNDRRASASTSRVSFYVETGFDSNGNLVYDVINSSYVTATPQKKTIWGTFRNYTTVNRLSVNHSLRSFNNICQYGDNFSYQNEWTGIDFNGSFCVIIGIPEANLSSCYSTMISSSTNYNNQGGVNINLICQ
jgi:hypothetical protein